MTRESRVGIGALSAAEADLVDEICDRFEAALSQGVCALLENYLEGVGEPVFSALLLELLITELEQKQGRDPQPALEDYRKRFPGRDELIALAFQQASRSQRVPKHPVDSTEGDPGGSSGRESPTAPGRNDDDTHTQVHRNRDDRGANAGAGRGDTDTSVISDSGGSARAVPIDLLPDFLVLEEIGRGGMGVVYKAVQRNLNRKVALKVLPLAFASDPIRLARFRNEASIAANLRDARIVPVFDIKEAGGTLVLIMPYVEGRDLAKILAERKKGLRLGDSSGSGLRHSSTAEREHLAAMLPLLDQVIAAVAAIHEAGVVHRDIKPSNILVDSRGDIQLSDFGLARLGREAVITSAGAGLGTPGYMSPEQWEGREDVDLRTDVFGLGVTIYQALTLDLPYGKGRVSENDRLPEHPGRKRPRVPGDLGAVILKALEPDRELRYASAKELQEDWQRAREGGVPLAARRGRLRSVSRRLRRHSRMLAATMALATVLAAAAVALLGMWMGPGGPVPRTVALSTKPPGARIVMARLDDRTGEPDSQQVFRPSGRDPRTPVELTRVPPGEYFVEVVWEDGRFHQVYRRVPDVNDGLPSHLPIGRSRKLDSGVVELPEIKAPPLDIPSRKVPPGMAAFHPDEGDSGGITFPPWVGLPDYYLDQYEVTVQDYKQTIRRLPRSLEPLAPGPLEPVRYVSHDEAATYLERRGKRLPTEAEYLFAATEGGHRDFPGGDPTPYRTRSNWDFGPVNGPCSAYDRTDTDPPVFGLYSGVAEWTSTGASFPEDIPAKTLPVHPALLRIVHGGPPSVYDGQPDPNEFGIGAGHGWSRGRLRRDTTFRAGIGFRGARSAGPRFLGPAASAPAR